MSERNNENENLYDQGTEDSLEGKSDKLKGRVKDAWGGLTGDTSKQAEGKLDELKGNVKDKFGKIERDLSE